MQWDSEKTSRWTQQDILKYIYSGYREAIELSVCVHQRATVFSHSKRIPVRQHHITSLLFGSALRIYIMWQD